jgi:hypothetical protein
MRAIKMLASRATGAAQCLDKEICTSLLKLCEVTLPRDMKRLAIIGYAYVVATFCDAGLLDTADLDTAQRIRAALREREEIIPAIPVLRDDLRDTAIQWVRTVTCIITERPSKPYRILVKRLRRVGETRVAAEGGVTKECEEAYRNLVLALEEIFQRGGMRSAEFRDARRGIVEAIQAEERMVPAEMPAPPAGNRATSPAGGEEEEESRVPAEMPAPLAGNRATSPAGDEDYDAYHELGDSS